MEDTIRGLIGQHLLDEAGKKLLGKLDSSESLIAAGLLDSLGIVQLISHLEREYEVVLDPMDISIENLESIDRIVSLLRSKGR